ncbi:MAG: hypothetical protein F4Z97_03945 [Gammaproteobacteria bacterium]|nr:hypothetical protein [Gammaproteobacteria bacterium]
MFLLPGFIAAAIFYSLISHSRPSSFERIIVALIFTFFVQLMMPIVQAMVPSIVPTQQDSYGNLAWLAALVAIVWGVLTALCINHDWPHKLFRKLKITKETTYSSEWYSAFSQYEKSYVVLHLYDGRRVYGWPTEWPSRPAEGHFHLEEADWMEESKNNTNSRDRESVKSLLIPVIDVQIVEFVPVSEQSQV